MLDPSLLGEVSADEVATHVDIPRQRLNELLSGKESPNIHELAELADALDQNPSYLLRPRPAVVARRDSGIDDASLDQLLERLDLHVSAFRRELGQPETITEAFPVKKTQAARRHGEAWAGRNSPVWDEANPDILARRIEEVLHIPVLIWPVADAPFGATLNLGGTFAIWVNSHDVPGTQQRFTLAHELGHILLRHAETHHIEMTRTAREAEQAGTPDRRDHEVQANAFAGGTLYDYDRLTQVWSGEVSAAAIGRVAGALGISYGAARVALNHHLKKRAGGFDQAASGMNAWAAFEAGGVGHVYNWAEKERNRKRLPGILPHAELLGQALEADLAL